MGFDTYCISELIVPENDVTKAVELIKEYHKTSGSEYYQPAIKNYGGHHELVAYDLFEVEMGEDEYFIHTEDDKEVIGNLHNDTLYEILHPYVTYLRDNGVFITGWIYINYDGIELSYTFYLDGDELGYLNELGLGRMCMRHVLNDGRIDFDLVNNVVKKG